MKVAAYQAPLSSTANIPGALCFIREQVKICEENGVEILCCPEAVLGGLADCAGESNSLNVGAGELDAMLAPLASDTVTTIIGFTEIEYGNLYNSAAVFHRGSVMGVYRKMHPAVNHSVYAAGTEAPIFTVDGMTFGIIICYDSNFTEPAQTMAARGAQALFIPTNNGLPREKDGAKIAAAARECDIRLAIENNVYVVRADVVGEYENMSSQGSSAITAPDGSVIAHTQQMAVGLMIGSI